MKKGVDIFEPFGSVLMKGRKMHEHSNTTSTRSKEEVARDVKLGGNGKRSKTEEVARKVHNECVNFVGFGHGEKRLVDMRIAEKDDLQSESFMACEDGG